VNNNKQNKGDKRDAEEAVKGLINCNSGSAHRLIMECLDGATTYVENMAAVEQITELKHLSRRRRRKQK
jgi:hypothetical protein